MSGFLLIPRCLQQNLPKKVLVQSLRIVDSKYDLGRFSTSSNLSIDDKDIKSDPDVKNILKEINKAFDNTPSKKPDISIPNSSTEEAKDTVKTNKNISQLLSELYGEDTDKKEALSSVGGYKEYVDSDSTVIYDIDEERELMKKAYLEGKPMHSDKKSKPSPAEKYQELSQRGLRGVFEITELVDLLKKEKVLDLVVLTIPASKQYADFMVVGTARSTRHLRTVGTLVRSVFKRKRYSTDPIPRVEGADDEKTGWIALDMGNIVLHLLVQEQREYYDLETLWAVGPEFDDNARKLSLAEKQSYNLDTLVDLMATEIDFDELARNENESLHKAS